MAGPRAWADRDARAALVEALVYAALEKAAAADEAFERARQLAGERVFADLPPAAIGTAWDPESRRHTSATCFLHAPQRVLGESARIGAAPCARMRRRGAHSSTASQAVE